MKSLETNDWIILNNIIYKIYTTEDFDEMRTELLEQLKMLVDFDSADFYLSSAKDGKALTDAVTKANTAMQSFTMFDKKIENGGKVTVDDVKTALRLKSAAYVETSYFDKAGTAQGLINGLGGSATGTGDFVTVKVDTLHGEANKVTVIESDTLKNAVNGSIQTINGDLPYLKADRQGTTVNLDFDQTEVFNYVSSNIWETYSA